MRYQCISYLESHFHLLENQGSHEQCVVLWDFVHLFAHLKKNIDTVCNDEDSSLYQC